MNRPVLVAQRSIDQRLDHLWACRSHSPPKWDAITCARTTCLYTVSNRGGGHPCWCMCHYNFLKWFQLHIFAPQNSTIRNFLAQLCARNARFCARNALMWGINANCRIFLSEMDCWCKWCTRGALYIGTTCATIAFCTPDVQEVCTLRSIYTPSGPKVHCTCSVQYKCLHRRPVHLPCTLSIQPPVHSACALYAVSELTGPLCMGRALYKWAVQVQCAL